MVSSSQEEKYTPTEEEPISQDSAAIERQHQAETVIEPSETIYDPKDIRIAELESAITKMQQKERDIVLRMQAEMENVRRRSTQAVEKAHKFALERFASELLPVIDNLERALNMSDQSNSQPISSIIEGIELTLKALLDVVCKFGIKVINETNVPFNPELHQAITILESDDYEPNTVILVIQKGYTLHGRLIRPAMVSVSRLKQEDQPLSS